MLVFASSGAAERVEIMRIQPALFVRGVTSTSGAIRRSAVVNGWTPGLGAEFTGSAPAFAEPIAFMSKPVPGHSDMIVGVPTKPLVAGAYTLLAEPGPFGGAAVSLDFVVEPLAEAEARNCVDETRGLGTGFMYGDAVKMSPCGPASKAGEAAAGVAEGSARPAAARPEGRWEGDVNQPGYPPYPMVLVFSGQGGTSEYPSLQCAGTLTFVDAPADTHRFRERIVTGREKCMDGLLITVQRKGDRTMVGAFTLSSGLSAGSFALSKKD